MTADPMATSLWSYSLRVYERAGIPAVLIGWQDGLGADVNLALWCTWVSGFRHHRLDEPTVAAADRAVCHWRERVVQPLRAVRNDIKQHVELSGLGDAPAARQAVLAAELAAERVVQTRLQLFSESHGALMASAFAAAAVASGLAPYWRYLGTTPPADEQQFVAACAAASGRQTVDTATGI